ncbi:MAG: O-Antigen ligase [Candidatus Kentron sp. G]|nr:MAG: O-Antigen ligase [Candidatus Kentron sp. G]VFM95779.1 MAG: O-Antigen ligase [Candidatus Kentron sp. G]VFM97358.1 MAG: O-Antigen ligase [Candidatus Kentron sp. G]
MILPEPTKRNLTGQASLRDTRTFDSLTWPLAALLLFAPLFRSGQPPLAQLVLQLGALALIAIAVWSRARVTGMMRSEWLALSLLLITPLLFLVPLPASWAAMLPGQAPYHALLELVHGGDGVGWRPISLNRTATWGVWLALLPPIVVYLAARQVSAERVLQLSIIIILMAVMQALLGLLQYMAGDGPLFLGMSSLQRATGTYTNPNHLAGLIEMTLPVAIGLYVYSLGQKTGHSGWHARIAFLATIRGHRAFWFAVLAVILLLGIIFSRSRTGIAVMIFGTLLLTILFSRRLGGYSVYGRVGTLLAFVAGLGFAIGLAPIFSRFAMFDPIEDGRLRLWSYSLDGIATFFPVGSGPGTFSDVFPAFQGPDLGRWFINHAHNDYLEWVFEGGIIALVVMLLLAGLFARQWVLALKSKGQEWGQYRFLQIGAGIGLSLLLLHESTDYNLMMPANAIYFAFFAGVFMRDFRTGKQHVEKHLRPRTPYAPSTHQEQAIAEPADQATRMPRRQHNPFMD